MGLSLKLLGEFAVGDGAGKALSLPTRKTRALLGYLAVNADKSQQRERLMALLWGDRGEKQARHSLNQALMSIRKLGGDAGATLLDGDGRRVTLCGDAIETDLAKFRAMIADDSAGAVALYDGPFLDGLAIPDAAFEQWLMATRAEFHNLACDALERAAERAAGASDLAGAIDFARRLVALDPLREDGHRRLMKLLHDSGDRTGALRQYQACLDVLKKELQVEPDAATRALFEEIRKTEADKIRADEAVQTTQPPALDVSTAMPEKPSIAVFPFTNLGGDPAQEYLAEGIRLDLQTMLVRIPGLFIVSASPVTTHHAAGESAGQVAAAVGVRYILEGAVQKSNDRIRITVQMTDTVSERVIWAERYDRPYSDGFSVQDEITGEVLTALDIKLLSGERYRYLGTLRNLEARDRFYLGLSHFYANTKKDNDAAIRYFEKVTDLQPDSPVGPTYLCLCHWREAFSFSPESHRDSLKKALACAEKSMMFGRTNGLAHIVMASDHLMNHRHEEALATSYKAFHLRPNCPVANASLAQILLCCGECEEAITTVKLAMRISVVYPPWFANVLAAAYREAGELEAAILTARETFSRHPDDVEAGLNLCSSYQRADRNDRAQEVAQRILAIDPIFSVKNYTENQHFRDAAISARLSDSLLKAGLPE